MSPRSAALALLILLLAAPLAHAGVGFQHLQIPDPGGPPIEVGIWYPTDAPPTQKRQELVVFPVARDAPVKGAGLPLVVISHGTGGSYAGHVDTAMALAEEGFVAAALTHTGDNWRDHSAAARISDRPRQLKVLTDYMLSAWPGHDRIDPARVGAFGFSAGGFTVLAAAGGEPDLTRVAPHCQDHPAAFECRVLASRTGPPPSDVAIVHDPRIRAVVAAAPALGYAFGREGLAGVRQPVQLWRAENDHILPAPDYADAVRAALPAQPEFHLVKGADHFDFLAPCSPALAKLNPQICTSAAGFDRAAFHADFDRDVVGFFARTLAK